MFSAIVGMQRHPKCTPLHKTLFSRYKSKTLIRTIIKYNYRLLDVLLYNTGIYLDEYTA